MTAADLSALHANYPDLWPGILDAAPEMLASYLARALEEEERRTYVVPPPDADEFAKEWARRSLLEFTQYTYPGYEVNWHHRAVCNVLDRVMRGELRRVMLFMPPRHGKSELVSRRLPAYALGRNPNLSIISASYSGDLASRMNRDVQRIMDDARYAALFPKSTLNEANIRTVAGSYLRNSDLFEVVGSRGVYRSSGVGGGITGMGFDLGLIDDPIKNRAEAESVTYRDNVWDWYASTFYTRQMQNASIILTLTRWHEDDLAGRLLKQMRDDPAADQWTVLRFPALAEPRTDLEPVWDGDPREIGEPLWPARYGERFLSTTRAVLGTYEWLGLYQQRPTASKGGIFQRDTFCYWTRDPNNPDVVTLERPEAFGGPRRISLASCSRFTTVDLAASLKTHADYTVVATWAISPWRDLILLDVTRGRFEGPDQPGLIRLHAQKHRPSVILVESNGYQLSLVQTLVRDGLPVRPLQTDRDKVSRASTAGARMAMRTVFFPAGAPYLADCEGELLAFPFGSHDDFVDVLAHAALHVWQGTGMPLILDPSEGARVSPWKGL